MQLVTATQMRALDREAIGVRHIPSIALMERAGLELANVVAAAVPAPGPIGIVLGQGNNAGDGLVAARYLHQRGYRLHLFLTSAPTDFSPDARVNWDNLADHGTRHQVSDGTWVQAAASCVCLIDALFGTGLDRPVAAPTAALITTLNGLGRPIIAADVPSGLCATTGAVLGVAVRAEITVAFGLPKLGCVLGEGPRHTGRLCCVDIGIPVDLTAALVSSYRWNGPDEFASHWPVRPVESHKGTYGHALIVAGSLGKIGAGYLAARAALRSGAGLVTYALPTTAYDRFSADAVEVMLAPLPDEGSGCLTAAALVALGVLLRDKAAIAVGPGLGQDPRTADALYALVRQVEAPLVVDADAITALAASPRALAKRRTPIIMTPHPGEMARWLGVETETVQNDRIGCAQRVARERGCYVVLKGHWSVIATPAGEVLINPTGNPGMATAGSGDVLTGVLTGLLAQGMPPREATCAAVYLHGMAGDLAAERLGQAALIASDIIDSLPAAIQCAIPS
ncbi:MAG: NAD(P)H-hydrate dehydratase [Deltaproteobacteria bacterium]|nr:NAD(P)H-hydrate dehydratase [Deltaproteobacteria bacterium]